jgi:hypothetical protein
MEDGYGVTSQAVSRVQLANPRRPLFGYSQSCTVHTKDKRQAVIFPKALVIVRAHSCTDYGKVPHSLTSMLVQVHQPLYGASSLCCCASGSATSR